MCKTRSAELNGFFSPVQLSLTHSHRGDGSERKSSLPRGLLRARVRLPGGEKERRPLGGGGVTEGFSLLQKKQNDVKVLYKKCWNQLPFTFSPSGIRNRCLVSSRESPVGHQGVVPPS